MASKTSDRSSSIPSRRGLRPLLGLGLVASLPALMGAEGGCTLLQGTLESPVQAITVLREHADGSVDVDLVVISTADDEQRYVTTMENAELRTPQGDLIALTQDEDGHYRASSHDQDELVYEPGGTNYRVTFDLDDEQMAGEDAGGDFIAVVQAPDAEPSFELSKAPDFAGDTSSIRWAPAELEGLLEIRDASGEIVFSTFDLATPNFDGGKWGSLIHRGHADLPVDVFAEPGRYTLSFCAVQSQEGLDEELSAGLGVLSGFLAGRCVDDLVIDVAQ